MADDGGSRDEAIRWYDTYLAESPGGPFVAEALGRKLVAVVESGDTVGARSVAREYLRRFPHGAHAVYAHDHMPEP
jgi:outer membrane protein assembly factor BamD (BamD/ComL family)